jgi:hypothetical protein
MDWQEWVSQLIAAAALAIITFIFFWIGPQRAAVKRTFAYRHNGADVQLTRGTTVDPEVLQSPDFKARFTGADPMSNYVKLKRGALFRTLYAGKDGRWSTSKIQPLMWTYAVVFGLAAILVAKLLGEAAGWDKQVSTDLQAEYLLLLGGPFAAAVIAKISTTAKIEQGALDKSEPERPPDSKPMESLGQGLSDIVRDDNGSLDLGDFQYFLFNLLALAFFFGAFIPDPEEGLPQLPEMLVGLTGVSAAAYVANKAIEGETPTLKEVVPAKAAPGSKIVIWGQNLVPSGVEPSVNKPTVTIAETEAVVEEVVANGSRTKLVVTVRPATAIGAAEIRVITASGFAASLPAGGLPFEVISGVRIADVRPGKIPNRAGQEVLVLGSGFLIGGTTATAPRIEIDGTQLETSTPGDDGQSMKGVITAEVAERLAEKPHPSLVVKNNLGQSSDPYIVEILPVDSEAGG